MYNTWGGPMEVAMDSEAENDVRSRNLDFDRASVKSLEETQQSWLLEPKTKKKVRQVDLGCMTCSRKLFLIFLCVFLTAGAIVGFSILIWKVAPRKHHHPPPLDNYTIALQMALRFFDAQKSGHLPPSNNISWRGASGLSDGKNAQGGPPSNLTGGFYDAGDNIKFNFPGAYALTLLSWSVIEYKSKFEAAGELNHIRDNIKWGTDYLLRSFNYSSPNPSYVFAQVGQANTSTLNDHYCWERPEDMDYPRVAYAVPSAPDLGAEMAAALAAASIVFETPRILNEVGNWGKKYMDFCKRQRKRQRYDTNIPIGEQVFYNSTSYWDEYMWGAAWMYYATGNLTYLSFATNPELARNAVAKGGGPYFGVFDWDNKLIGAQVLLTRLRILQGPGYPYESMLQQYQNETNTVMCSYLPQFKTYNVTKGGLTQFNHGRVQPLQYTVANSFLAAVYADYMRAADVPGWNCPSAFYTPDALTNFSRSQLDYILGHNPMNMSYVVGYGKKYPKQVHHRGASIPTNGHRVGCTQGWHWRDINAPNPHVIIGAMVAGPNRFDKYVDRRTNYAQAEPTLAGNAALVAALISVSTFTGSGVDANTIFNRLPPCTRLPLLPHPHIRVRALTTTQHFVKTMLP